MDRARPGHRRGRRPARAGADDAGKLLPPPAGGPIAPQLRGLALANLHAAGIQGEDAPALAAVIAGAIAQGISLLCASASIAPGIPVAGFVTAAPGRLL